MKTVPLLKSKDQAPGEGNHLFPVFLKLEELEVLLVGAGNVGLEKLQAILHNAPATRVHVVAAEVSEGVKAFAAAYPAVNILQKEFDDADLLEKDVVIVAVNNKEISRVIRDSAKERKLLVNVADTPELCDFYLGSIVQKGSVKIAISTNGKSPTMAKRLKEVLQHALPNELNGIVDNLHTIRTRLNGNFAHKVKKLDALKIGVGGTDYYFNENEQLVEFLQDLYPRFKFQATLSLSPFPQRNLHQLEVVTPTGPNLTYDSLPVQECPEDWQHHGLRKY